MEHSLRREGSKGVLSSVLLHRPPGGTVAGESGSDKEGTTEGETGSSDGFGYRQGTFSSGWSHVIPEADETGTSRPSSGEIERLEKLREGNRAERKVDRDGTRRREDLGTETDNAIVTAEALSQIIEDRLRALRGESATVTHSDATSRRSISDIADQRRPLSGHRYVEPPLTRTPSSGIKDKLSKPEDGRPVSGSSSPPSSRSRLSKRPTSGTSSFRPNSGRFDKRPLSSREARLNALNVSKPPNPISNFVGSLSTAGNTGSNEYLSHTGPRPSFTSFFEVSDTISRIRKWSQFKYRTRLAESRKTPESSSQKRTNDSRRSRQSSRRLQEMADTKQADADAEARALKRRTRTFIWYARVIKAVVKLALDMQKLSMRKTEQTPISEMYYINIAGPSVGEDPSQQLFFDKSWFSRKRATSRVPLWAQAVAIKRPDDRAEKDILRLNKLLLGMRSFKEKFTEDMRLKMCQVVRYTQCNKGRVVLRQGHYGQDFYFIYSGSVFIQIDIEDATTGTVKTTTENIIRHGESFGEIALMGDGERSACVICREPTELFQIDKTTFMDVCPGIFRDELSEKMKFAEKFPIFRGWDADQFESLCFNSQVLYIPHGRSIETDWAKSNYIYFVMKGRISLLKEFNVSDMLDMTAQGMMDKELHFRRPENDERVIKNKQACVGAVREKEHSDLRILSLEPSSSIETISLQSEGVKVLRVAVRTFNRMCPRRSVEEYLKKEYAPMVFPNNVEICEKVFKDAIWTSYKKSVLRTVELEQAGFAIAHLPATVKGTSGWARWPGFDDDADEKSGRLTERKARSYVDPFLIVSAPKWLSHSKTTDPQPRVTERLKESKAMNKPDIILETDEEHGILPIIVKNDRALICKPRGVTNVMELRTNVSRLVRTEEVRAQLHSASAGSGKSVFITEHHMDKEE